MRACVRVLCVCVQLCTFVYICVYIRMSACTYIRTYVCMPILYGIWLKKVHIVRAYYGSTCGSKTNTDMGVFVKDVWIQIWAFL